MASVYGSKVKEPTLTRRNVLSVDGRASYAADLAKAWSSFGEAKSVLQKLESKALSPSAKDRPMHSSKPCTVHFKPQPETVRPVQQSLKFSKEDFDTGPRVPGILKGSTTRESGKDNVYVLEPATLNEQEEDDKVQRSPQVPFPKESLSDRPQVSSQAHTLKSGVGPASSTSPHSNATAVFGLPVHFGGIRGGQRSSAMKTSRQTQDRPLPNHTTTHPTRTNPGLNHDHKTVPVSGPGPSTRSIHVLPHSVHLGGNPCLAGERPNAHIRKFELPPEVVGTLSAKVELQKQAVKDKSASHRPRRGIETNGHHHHTSHSHTDYNPVTKKRKVTSVPPPPTYSGFSSIRSTQSETKAAPPSGPRATSTYKDGPIQWKPNVEKVGMPATRTSFKPSVGMRTHLSKTGGDRVRKVHRMPSSDMNVQGTPVGSSKEPAGLITTSSWRAGKELTDKILREGQRHKSKDPPSTLSSPPSSIHLSFDLSPNCEPNLPQVTQMSDHSVTGPHTGTHYTQAYTSGAKPESCQTKDLSRKKFDDILVDLELSVEDGDSDIEESGERPEERRLKRPLSSGPGVGTSKGNLGDKKLKHTYNEPAYPTERVRHYDQTKVQVYMQRQKEERRRKAQEQKQMMTSASSERQKKLRELYETQRKRVESNLLLKQKKREAYAKSLSAGIHIHLHDTASSTTGSEAQDAPVPTLTIHPAPTTHHRSSRSREPFLSSSQTRPSGSMAPRIQTSPLLSSPPSHLHPSPPSHPHPSPHTSPSRYNRLRVHRSSEAIHSTQKGQSPPRSVSPRTYTIRSSPTTSPRERDTTTTAHAQLSPREYQRNPSPPPTGKLTALLRGGTQGPYTAVPSPPKTHEERLQAIKMSALRLKERIANESKKAFEDSYSEPSFEKHDRARYPSDTPSSEPTRYHHQTNEQGRTPTELPGVRSMYEHALQAEQDRQQTEAAIKIQAAYRGHSVRKSFNWELPTGRTLNSIIKGATPPVEQPQNNKNVPLNVVTSSTSTVPGQPLPAYSPSESGSHTPTQAQPDPTPSVVEPWKQGGGDNHSVINVFTRQQERLRETLSLLSDRKREEIRKMAAGENARETSPVHVTVSLSVDLSTIEGEDSQEQMQHSYSQAFESNSSIQDDGSVRSDSQLSAPFSRDSLFSQPSPQHSPQPVASAVNKSPPSQSQPEHSPSTITSDVPVSSPEKELSAITPPGSPSFVESFSSHTPSHPPHVPPTVVHSHSGPPGGRLSPRSLELNHQAQLNLYETVEEHLRHVTHVERARDLSLAQQETVTLAQQFKTHEQAHKEDMDTLASKAKKDIEVVQRRLEDESKNSSERMKHLQEQVDLQMKEHSRRLADMQEESAQAAREATFRLNDARSAATSAVIEAAQQQIQAAHTMAVSVAKTATKEAVREAMRQDTAPRPTVEQGEQSVHEMEEAHYESDFDPSTMQPDSLAGSEVETDHSTREHIPPTETVSIDIEDGSTRDDTLTPSSVGDGAGDSTLVDERGERSTGSSSPREVEEDGSEISFCDVLQSEGPRRRKSRRDQHNSFSESEEVGVACSGSRSNTPSQDDRQSPFSPAGEDSFFLFTSRMVAEYVKQEELRASHQAALLHLREKALKEKTEVQLKWLQLKKRDLHSKGADDLMPPLKKKEKGLLREFKQEQAEIHRLKEAQEAARHERKLMLLDQREISKIRNSTRYYREKIRSYRSRSHASPSPAPSFDDSITSHGHDHSRSHDYSRSMTPDYSIFSDISGMEESQDTSAAPSEHLESSIPLGTSYTFPTYSPSAPQDGVTSDHKDRSSRIDPTASVSENIEGGSLPSGSFSSASRKKSRSPLASKKREKSTSHKTSESVTLKSLNKTASNDAERYLAKRKQSLLKRRQAAERAIQQHRDLLKKQQELDKEEESVNKLVVEAMEILKQTSNTRARNRNSTNENLNFDLLDTSHEQLSSSLRSSKTPASVSEDLRTTSSIREEISLQNGADPSLDKPGTVTTEVPSAYAVDTFESLDSTFTLHHNHPVTTSTPESGGQAYSEVDDLSLLDSVQVTGSVSESLATTTSGGSVLEERIRVLKEQLRQKKEEVKKIQNEQKRKKKAMLKQQEEKLKRKLEAVDQKAKRVIVSPPPPSHSLSPDTRTSSTLSVASDVEHHTSSPLREGSISPSHIEDKGLQGPQLDSQELGVVTSTNKENISDHFIQQDLSVSYTPFTSDDVVSVSASEDKYPHTQTDVIEEGKDKTLTPPHSVRSESPQSDGGRENESVPEELTVTEDLESNVESVEPLVPPPGFEDDSSTGDHSTHSEQLFEINPPHLSPTESFDKQLSSELVNNADILPDEMPAKDESLPGGDSTLVDEEEQVRMEYSLDFEPEDELENERSPQPEDSDLDARSDSSLISDSKGGDSGDETNYHTGQRVLVGGVKEGIVRFVGHTHFSSGVWIGVEIGEPRGKNDGSVDGERYFTCPPKQGLFAPPNRVSIIEDVEDDQDAESGSLQGSSIDEELESVHTGIDTEDEEEEEERGTHVQVAVDQSPHLDTGRQDEYTEDFEPFESEKSENQSVDESSHHRSYTQPFDKPTSTSEKGTEQILQESAMTGGTTVVEQQAPAAVQSVGERPDGLPKAPEVTLQRLQSATPTPAPPPEFAEGASREASTEPPAVPTEPPHVDHKPEKLSDELAQELMNEAYQTMHQIWKAKRDVESVEEVKEEIKTPGVVQIPKDKDIPLGLDEKADRITDQLLFLLLQSETSLMSNIHTSKKIIEEDSREEQLETEPNTPPRHHPPLQISLTGGVSIKESSPPPLSPPSPYRLPAAMMFSTGDHSPPGSPPCHLSQLSAARVAAGENSPPLVKQEPLPLSSSKLERTNSMESIVNLLDSIKLTTAQCMVPSERPHIDEVVENAWKVARDIGFAPLHSMEVSCPSHILNLFKDIRVLSPEEEHCHQAFVKLVFDLTLEVIRLSHPVQDTGAVWLHGCTVKAPLASSHTNEGTIKLEVIQKHVYAALIRGQLPTQLPAVKFLHRMKRPGGKEVDFVDSILIKELRGEEPGWIDYHKDETTVKMKTADTILDSLLSEAVQIMCNIEQKRKQNG